MTNEDGSTEDLYDLKESAVARPAPNPITPKRVTPTRETASPVLPYQAKSRSNERALDTDRLKNFQLPMLLLVVGSAIEVIMSSLLDAHPARATVLVLIDISFGTAFMLAGVFIAARFRQIELGDLKTAALKLAAVCVAPAAVAALFSPVMRFVPLGGLVVWIVQFILYFALLGALFDLDESDTWYCVWTIFLVRVAAYFAIVGLTALL